MACRALTYMMEALPSSTATIVSHQAVPLLCSKFVALDYLDLVEQVFQVCLCNDLTLSVLKKFLGKVVPALHVKEYWGLCLRSQNFSRFPCNALH